MSFRKFVFVRISLFALPVALVGHFAQAQTPPLPPSPAWPYEEALPGAPPPASGLPTDEAPRPPEPASAPFGAQGQVVLGGGTSLGVSSTQFDGSAATHFSAEFSPEVDYFVLKNFSIGVGLGVSYADNRSYGADGSLVETKTTSFSAGPRFGLNVPLGNAFSWWLEGTVGIESNRSNTTLIQGSSVSTGNSSGATDSRQDGPWVSLYLPLILHPTSHLYMGAGPSLFHEFAALQGGPNVGDQRTTFGAGFILGGYWGGSPGAARTPAAAEEQKPRPLTHFGERGDVLFSNELVGSVYSTSYAGTASSVFQGQLTLGIDYFFVDHVSVGAGVSGGWYNSTGSDANGNTVTNNDTSFAFFARLGVNIPLAGPVSLYPRVVLGTGGGHVDEKSSAGEDSYSLTQVWVSAYAPVVLEIAPHLVAGVGPSASRDLSSTASFANGGEVQNPSTTLGAAFMVGGWL